MAFSDPINVVANRVRDALGRCANPDERFSAERVERATGILADDVHLIAQGLHEPDSRTEQRLRLLDRTMREASPPKGVPLDEWLLLRQETMPAAPALLIRELRVSELEALL